MTSTDTLPSFIAVVPSSPCQPSCPVSFPLPLLFLSFLFAAGMKVAFIFWAGTFFLSSLSSLLYMWPVEEPPYRRCFFNVFPRRPSHDQFGPPAVPPNNAVLPLFHFPTFQRTLFFWPLPFSFKEEDELLFGLVLSAFPSGGFPFPTFLCDEPPCIFGERLLRRPHS